jgi:hypothetical protein
MGSRTVLWLGGMSGVGKTTAGRAVARRYDLWFYSLDSRTYAHAEAMKVPALEMTADQLWVDRTPQQMADDFEAESRRRFPLVLEDIAAIPDDGAPILVDGPQLLPDLVNGPALFLIATPALQRALVSARGSFTYSRARDPERALANRVRRDEVLAVRLRPLAVEVERVEEVEPLVVGFVREHTPEWISRNDRGDVALRRRDENERRLDQWRRYAEVEPRVRDGTVDFACECDRPGCTAVVPRTLAAASYRPRLAHGP